MGSEKTETSSKTADYSIGLKYNLEEVKASPIVAHEIKIPREEFTEEQSARVWDGINKKIQSDPPERISEPSVINQLGQDITPKDTPEQSTFDASVEALRIKFGY